MNAENLSTTGPAAFGVIAERFRRAGQPEKAATLCREGLEKFPDHLSARVTLGWSLLDMGEFQEAFDQLKIVLKRAPDNLAAIRGLAELHERGIGLVFDSMPEAEPEPEVEAASDIDPAFEGDFDPIMPAMEPQETVIAAAAAEAVYEPELIGPPAPQFEIEDVMGEELPGAFDLSGLLDPEPQANVAAFDQEHVLSVAPEPEPLPRPVSMFERAPLALRDEADLERVGELQDWLSRVRAQRSDSVSQYVAG